MTKKTTPRAPGGKACLGIVAVVGVGQYGSLVEGFFWREAKKEMRRMEEKH